MHDGGVQAAARVAGTGQHRVWLTREAGEVARHLAEYLVVHVTVQAQLPCVHLRNRAETGSRPPMQPDLAQHALTTRRMTAHDAEQRYCLSVATVRLQSEVDDGTSKS